MLTRKLAEAHLPQPWNPNVDIHPKGPNCDQALAAKTFRGNIRLYSHRTHPESKITDEMLRIGCRPDKMSKRDRDIWIKDIEAGWYTVKIQKGKGKEKEGDLVDAVEDEVPLQAGDVDLDQDNQ